MNRIHLIKLLISACTILILLGCTAEDPPPTQTRTSEAAPLTTLRPTVQTNTPSPSAPDPTPSPTITLETATALPTMTTPTQTIAAATLTPLPTLEGEELELAVAELLANPMNCDVPCWWGAIPNETTGFEVQQFLNLYQFTTYIKYEDEKPDFPSSIEVWVGFERDVKFYDFRVFYGFTNNILQGVFSEHGLLLDDALAKYGQPDEVWLETMGFEPPGSLPFRLNLVYLQAGLAVGYVVDGDIEEDVVIGCFAEAERGHLQMNKPDEITNYRNFRGIFEVDRRYLPLEEATELTREDFMQLFSDPTQPQCIETPAELWE